MSPTEQDGFRLPEMGQKTQKTADGVGLRMHSRKSGCLFCFIKPISGLYLLYSAVSRQRQSY